MQSVHHGLWEKEMQFPSRIWVYCSKLMMFSSGLIPYLWVLNTFILSRDVPIPQATATFLHRHPMPLFLKEHKYPTMSIDTAKCSCPPQKKTNLTDRSGTLQEKSHDQQMITVKIRPE